MADTTASRNRFGQYYRRRATPVNPKTASQGDIRTQLIATSQAYRGLTDAQRSGWAAYGLSITRTDRIGSAYTLTGQQAYSMVNVRKIRAGNAQVPNPPITASVPTTPAVSIVADSGAGTIIPTWAPSPLVGVLGVWLSPPLSAGVTYVSRFAQVLFADSATTGFDLAPAWTALFGPLVAGQRIAGKAQLADADSGQTGGMVFFSTIVV